MAADVRHHLHFAEAILVALLVLSAVGIGIADISPEYGFRYWAAMIPVFAAISLFASWSQARRHGAAVGTVIRVQLFHWIGLLLALYVVFLLQHTGRLNNEDAGLVALLALALGTFLAGVHFDWRLCVVGILLGCTVAVAALVEEFLWMLLLPAGLIIVVAVFRWRRSRPLAHGTDE